MGKIKKSNINSLEININLSGFSLSENEKIDISEEIQKALTTDLLNRKKNVDLLIKNIVTENNTKRIELFGIAGPTNGM